MKTSLLLVLPVCLLFESCSPKAETAVAQATPAATVDNRVKESDLTRVTLSPEAEKRLGLELAPVVEREAAEQLSVAGEVVPIPGRILAVTAPVAGTVALARRGLTAGQTVSRGEAIFRLTPMLAAQPDLKATSEAEVLAAKARLDAATKQLQRARQLLQDLAGSQRSVEAAEQEFGQAMAAHDAAEVRRKRLAVRPLEADVDIAIAAPAHGILRQIQAADGQNVNGGAPLFEIADFSRVWLRVPVYAGDLNTLSVVDRVAVRDIDGAGSARQAARVAAPPTADPLAVTTDLYFELPNSDLKLRPGQRLMVVLPLRGRARRSLAVPSSAILYDIHGGTWVYVNETPHVYRRQRVELIGTGNQTAFLSRGVNPGTSVVKHGAAELFGTEFGAGH